MLIVYFNRRNVELLKDKSIHPIFSQIVQNNQGNGYLFKGIFIHRHSKLIKIVVHPTIFNWPSIWRDQRQMLLRDLNYRTGLTAAECLMLIRTEEGSAISKWVMFQCFPNVGNNLPLCGTEQMFDCFKKGKYGKQPCTRQQIR